MLESKVKKPIRSVRSNKYLTVIVVKFPGTKELNNKFRIWVELSEFQKVNSS